jgi:hypothetical protein
MTNIDFSNYDNVFCDSKEALDWLYTKGLPKDALVRTSSPAILLDEMTVHASHIESRWSADEAKKFQTTIKEFSENIYDAAISIENTSHEDALCWAQTAVLFHRLLFKAACLEDNDLIEKRLFVRAKGDGGVNGNFMNSPWDQLLVNNLKFNSFDYLLHDDHWGALTTKGVSLWNRIKIGGMETVLYRLSTNFLSKVAYRFYKRQALIAGENELIIETSSSLLLKGVLIRKITPKNNNFEYQSQLSKFENIIKPILKKRIKEWVVPGLVPRCENIFFKQVEENMKLTSMWYAQWKSEIKKDNKEKVVMTNASGNARGLALSKLCKELNIPVVSAQHGVTAEICETHGEVSALYEINYSDCFLAYNTESAKVSEKSHFSKGNPFVCGISKRHLRMNQLKNMFLDSTPSIVYISTNLYVGNLGTMLAWNTDYDRALDEKYLINKVFNLLPHKVRYKTYPEENRRYSDPDPIIHEVLKSDNIELFSEKVDMRFLLKNHRILVTSEATSTLGWPVMTGKPVVFINWHNNNPLTLEAHKLLSEGLFLFDDTEKYFHKNLLDFLSKPIQEIEKMWSDKGKARNKMINKFFTNGYKNAGKKSAQMILDLYL